jgi:hypothetical protein
MMPNEVFTLIILLTIGVMVLNLIFSVNKPMPKEGINHSLLSIALNLGFKREIFAIAIIFIGGIILYFYIIDKNIEHFKNNNLLLCNYNHTQIVVNKTNNYQLIDNYFIKNNIAIDIKNCQTLKENLK